MSEENKKKVLIVDDDAVTISLLQKMIEKKGFEVVLARNGEVALERTIKEVPDLILLDVEMPKMNGYMYITELKKHENLIGIPIIVVTSHEDMRNLFTRKEVFGFLTKPIEAQTLYGMIEEVIG